MSSGQEGWDLEALGGAVASLDLEGLDPREKYSAVVGRRFQRSMRELAERESEGYAFVKCRSCFLVKRDHCICEELSGLAGRMREVRASPEIRFIIIMNDREYFRSSNTGKLVRRLVAGSEILIHGLPESPGRLEEILSQDSEDFHETVILFPSRASRSVADYFSEVVQDRYPAFFAKEPEGSQASQDFFGRLRLKVILIDGTWSQAKSINKALPDRIPRIIISSKLISDFGPLRKQNKAGNISTVEAASLFIRDVSDVLARDPAATALADSISRLRSQSDILEESLRLLIRHVIAQCKREYLKQVLESRNEKRFSAHKSRDA
ncbi:yfiP-like protein [Cryptosporidium canis]|uniref:tRNA-uridine aminocarboxypropyltransferase n=1 Tax=Cryptosporidium canis TaxID=195482 RepID=A0ABQ8P4P6_9CRYT|nr:yfiP-like protein [Cryptosporidium canis]